LALEIITMAVGPLQANCYLAVAGGGGGEAAFLVDPGGDPDHVSDAVKRRGAPVKAIFITHGHHDHIGATVDMARATEAPIYGSAEVEAVLADPDLFRLFPGLPEVTSGRVDQVLSGGEEVRVGGVTVRALLTPGHSPGSLCYYTGGALFTGDLLFHGSVGRTDLPGGSFQQLARSVKALTGEFPPETVIYPGHGNASTLGEEKENNIFLQDIDW